MPLVSGGPIRRVPNILWPGSCAKNRSLMHIKAKFNLLFYKFYSRSHEGGAGEGAAFSELLRFGPPYLISLLSKTNIANRRAER
jgi:hypothetical protein